MNEKYAVKHNKNSDTIVCSRCGKSKNFHETELYKKEPNDIENLNFDNCWEFCRWFIDGLEENYYRDEEYKNNRYDLCGKCRKKSAKGSDSEYDSDDCPGKYTCVRCLKSSDDWIESKWNDIHGHSDIWRIGILCYDCKNILYYNK